jgi:hypothetical protein
VLPLLLDPTGAAYRERADEIGGGSWGKRLFKSPAAMRESMSIGQALADHRPIPAGQPKKEQESAST